LPSVFNDDFSVAEVMQVIIEDDFECGNKHSQPITRSYLSVYIEGPKYS